MNLRLLFSSFYMGIVAAIFFALAIIVAQAAHGGLLIPVLAYPAFALAALGTLLALPTIFASPRQPWPTVVVVIVVLSLYMICRCSNAPDVAFGLADAGVVLGCVAMWAGVTLALRRNDARWVFVSICLVAACVQVAIALVQIIKHGDFSQPFWLSAELKDYYSTRFPQRPRGLYLNPNQFAWLMNAMALMALSLGIWARVRVIAKIALLYLAAVFCVMTILSGSRGGVISLMAGFSVFLVLSLAAILSSGSHRRFLFLGIGIVVVTICAGLAYAAFSTSWVAQGRFSALLLPEVRGGFAEQAFRLFQTEPLFGVGAGMYRYAARLYRTGDVPGDPIFAHDDWLQFLAEYGFVAVTILVTVLLLTLIAGSRAFIALIRLASRETGNAMSSSGGFVLGAVCAIVAGAVHGSVDFNMHVPANALMTAALFGLVTGARPIEFEQEASRWLPAAWLTALAGLAASTVLIGFLIHRGEADFHSLEAANAFYKPDVKRVLDETEKGLRRLPQDPTLLALRGKAFFSYEAWLEDMAYAKTEKSLDEDIDSPEASGERNAKDGVVEDEVADEPASILSPAESAKNFRNAAEFFSHAVKEQPLERMHHSGWADALGALRLDGSAREQYMEAIRLDPFQPYAWGKYGDFLLDRDQVAAARRIYEVGASLPGGEYCRSQVTSIDEDSAPEEDEENSSQ